MKYIKQLDSIRAIAVLFVMIGHWFPHGYWIDKVPLAALGVDSFFVLSGFLITSILLDSREKAEKGQTSKGTALRNFYIRRTLRIFPIYYLTIFALLLTGHSGTHISSSFPWYLTYTSNFYFFENGWDGMLSHTWSLSVEEQFYLVWPGLMLFVSKRYLVYVMYAFIGIGVLSQFFLRGTAMANYLTFSCFDSFGMGALLASWWVYKPQFISTFYQRLKIPVLLAVIIFVAEVIQTKWPELVLIRTVNSVIALFIITYIVHKAKTGAIKFNFIWDNKILIFLGKISYGLYLYHYIIPHYFFITFKKIFQVDLQNILNPWLVVLIEFSIVTLVSWFSWLVIEKPILRLKQYFSYADTKNGEGVLVNAKV